VVGLVTNSLNKTVIIADPNVALIGGSNMEFLTMPMTKLQSKPTTTLSNGKTNLQIMYLTFNNLVFYALSTFIHFSFIPFIL